MCGIAGVLLLKGQIDERELVGMGNKLAHRGPDDAGIWIHQDGSLGLVHRRLSIIDLSDAAHQPMTNDDGTIVLVFNGEIYNFRELRCILQAQGHIFRSQSDTEVIIHAYEQWGMQAIEKLNGMFAFALYDQRQRCLMLGRDRFGEKPVFYYHHGGCFIFSSELKAIAAHSSFSPHINQDLLFPYLIFGYIPYPHTIFDHTFKLPPAHYMVLDVDSQNYTIGTYWNALETTSSNTVDDTNLESAVAHVDSLLADAVKLRLIADVPVGAFLSGGIDSSLIACFASRQKSDLKTFSIGFWDDQHDEAPYAKAIASHLGCHHHEYYVAPEEALSALTNLPGIYDEPFADSSAIPTYLLSRFAREHVKVTLTGDGGDELFGGYTTYSYWAFASHFLPIPKGLRTLGERVLATYGTEQVRRHAALIGQNSLWEVFLYLNERTVTKTSDAAKLLVGGGNTLLQSSAFPRIFEAAAGRGCVQAAMFTDSMTYLVDDILAKVDRASMAVSLEARVPFLDFRIAEYAMRLPDGLKMGPWRLCRKRILRTLLSRHMPRELFERPKKGFSVPLNRWFRGELKWLLDEYLAPHRLEKEGLFNAGFVAQLVREHLSGSRGREAVLWALVFWEMWRERWRI